MKIYLCKNCGNESPVSNQKLNIYCSNPCQREWQSKERIRQWLEEGKDWNTNIPDWAKRTLGEKRGYHCEECGIDKHNEKILVLECDHIDGDHTNNNIDNLRLICPNCHSQSSNYKNKNRGNGRKHRRKDFIAG
jgi:predicted RNA-binding Zn-ribbon protein involved in translation (DUF1610 family)